MISVWFFSVPSPWVQWFSAKIYKVCAGKSWNRFVAMTSFSSILKTYLAFSFHYHIDSLLCLSWLLRSGTLNIFKINRGVRAKKVEVFISKEALTPFLLSPHKTSLLAYRSWLLNSFFEPILFKWIIWVNTFVYI